jgi:hypothetical protein
VLSVGGVWLGQPHKVNVLCDRSVEYGGGARLIPRALEKQWLGNWEFEAVQLEGGYFFVWER